MANIFGCLHTALRHVFCCSSRSRLNRANTNGKGDNYRKERLHSTNDSFLTPRMRLPTDIEQHCFFAAFQSEDWARQDSNLGPRDYESPALTAELQAHLDIYRSSSSRLNGERFILLAVIIDREPMSGIK